jgi:hypothetical protein
MAAVPCSSLEQLARNKSDAMISGGEQNKDNVATSGKRNYKQPTVRRHHWRQKVLPQHLLLTS